MTLAAGALAALALTCATSQSPNAAKYPPRGHGCRVHIFHDAAPDVKEWDDLGIARVDCPLDLGKVQCLQRLREAACRMGGDLLYDVPKKPARPSEQGMTYVGHVAHTRLADGGPQAEPSDPQDEPDALDHRAPIEPLGAAPADAGPHD